MRTQGIRSTGTYEHRWSVRARVRVSFPLHIHGRQFALPFVWIPRPAPPPRAARITEERRLNMSDLPSTLHTCRGMTQIHAPPSPMHMLL